MRKALREKEQRGFNMKIFIHPELGELTVPTIGQLEKMSFTGITMALDGCLVEPDGYCEHGFPSWFIQLGICQ